MPFWADNTRCIMCIFSLKTVLQLGVSDREGDFSHFLLIKDLMWACNKLCLRGCGLANDVIPRRLINLRSIHGCIVPYDTDKGISRWHAYIDKIPAFSYADQISRFNQLNHEPNNFRFGKHIRTSERLKRFNRFFDLIRKNIWTLDSLYIYNWMVCDWHIGPLLIAHVYRFIFLISFLFTSHIFISSHFFPPLFLFLVFCFFSIPKENFFIYKYKMKIFVFSFLCFLYFLQEKLIQSNLHA